MSSQGHANTNGPNAPDRDKGLARAEDRMSAQGRANTNGPNAPDRDKGLARAQDRMSAHGSAHEKATAHARKHQGGKKSTATG